MIYYFRINITENKIFFEIFNISENNIISVELAWLRVKLMPIMLGKAQGEPIRASFSTKWARMSPLHDIKVWSGKFNKYLRVSCSAEILFTGTNV
jgi:hypothetical protein